MSFTKFVIVAQPRTGSTLLHFRLISHPHIVAYGELFHPAKKTRQRNTRGAKYPMLTHRHDPVEYLETHIFKPYRKIKAVGFKLFYEHAQNAEWRKVWDYIGDDGIKVIHLTRRNLLDSYLSLQLAHRTNSWVVFEKSNGGSKTNSITLDYEDCSRYFYNTEVHQQRIDAFFATAQTLSIVYEDLVAHPARESARVQTFLNVKHHELKTKTIKQQTRKQSEIIANYHQLKKQFQQHISIGKVKNEWLDFFRE